MKPAIQLDGVTKGFRVVNIPKRTTLKEAIVKFQFFNRGGDRERTIRAIDNVTLSVPQGRTLGIIGRNGSGKTTLLRLLAGVYKPDKGTISVAGNISLLSLGVGFHPDLSGRENVKIGGLVMGMSPKEIDRKFDGIVDFAEMRDFIDAPTRTYSSGMYMRLAFAIAASVDPDVLLLDEVLAVGDEAFEGKCLDRIRSFKAQGKTIVLVSHDASTIGMWCESTAWMDRGKLRAYGETAEVLAAYRAELHHAIAVPLVAAP
jgi:lipopolysaccharide transport system ATP-binding protein